VLKRLPESFPTTRDALHRVAEELVAPARKPQNEIALGQTPGGFGTPEFEFEGRRTQVRVERDELVLARDGDEDRAVLTSIAAGVVVLDSSLKVRSWNRGAVDM
jgi:two-component system CheB/CheR fusion protein